MGLHVHFSVRLSVCMLVFFNFLTDLNQKGWFLGLGGPCNFNFVSKSSPDKYRPSSPG